MNSGLLASVTNYVAYGIYLEFDRGRTRDLHVNGEFLCVVNLMVNNDRRECCVGVLCFVDDTNRL